MDITTSRGQPIGGSPLFATHITIADTEANRELLAHIQAGYSDAEAKAAVLSAWLAQAHPLQE